MAGIEGKGVDVDEVTSELKSMICSTDLTMSSKHCIFRVPNILFRHNPQAYEPNAFSIGPFHYNKPHLKATQDIKLKYLQSLLSRFSGIDMLRLLTGSIIKDMHLFRDCFAGPIGLTMDGFVKVLVLDSCFLVELLRKERYKYLRDENDPIFTVSCMREYLYHDLILLENQVPWLVLNRVFDLTLDPSPRYTTSLVELAVGFFNRDSATQSIIRMISPEINLHQSKHILDFIRNTMVIPFLDIKEDFNPFFVWQTIPSATALKEAGIEFKKSDRGSSESILNIRFENGVLEIPCLQITEITEPLFRNLISFEQCLPNCEGIVTSYAILMDMLINTTGDMEALCKSGILDNWVNIEDTITFFNRLYTNTYVKTFNYTRLAAELHEYCRRRWPRYRRVLMHNYFKHPWALVSVAAAVVLLILTLLQTIFTITK